MGEDGGFPYEKPRRGQLEAARSIAEAVSRGEVFILHAPTGFGKTSAIIYGLLQAGVERVLYVVRTRNEIQPVLKELKRFGVKGYSFLYSARRMCPALAGEGLSHEDFWETCRLLRLRGECSYYARLEEISATDVEEAIGHAGPMPRRVAELLAGQGYCPFFALKLLASEARFVVATYPYLFRPDIFQGTFDPLDYRDFVVVVDEAHSLLNIPGLLEARVSVDDLRSAQREVEEYGLPEEMGKALQELASLVSRSRPGEGKLRRLDRERLLRLLGDPEAWWDAAHEVRMAKIRERLEEGQPVRLSVALTRVARFAEMLAAEGMGAYSYTSGGRVGATVLPLEPCLVTRRPLNESRAAVLASGTLPASTLLRDLLCIEKPLRVYDVELLHGPVFPPRNQVTLVAAELTSRYTSRSREMYSLYARYILEAYRATTRVVMVVYPSYEFMQQVLDQLQQLARLEQVSMVAEARSTSIEEVLEKTGRGEKHLLVNAVAGGKLTEGIELVDENGRSMIGVVFVAGVPYPQPDDYFRDQFTVLEKRLGRAAARRLLFDFTAAVRARQAVGRARRSAQDSALVVLGDYRFLRRGLREHLRLRIDKVVYSLGEFSEAVRSAAEALGL
ncbi:hypothetical protein CF15_03060 [Pyrodictium occultum]|uniref:Helicase ATP-binding domain-containing protein n=1 Tax=Pyrodictium occultum TaxID=2309 RepID=A0A0V8RUR6_PYROC|nr:ATP-dependent DNA helicase [Pyrodictium occultum]KSW11797.1 hypothetical protein CF15_03060 [Pyrodictium occultum]